MLNLQPAAAPGAVNNLRSLRVATWNCTGSDSTAKLEQIAKLAWGKGRLPNRKYNDLVVIQEFSEIPGLPGDYLQLCTELNNYGWNWHKTANEGPNCTSQHCYFIIWNPNILQPAHNNANPVFVDIFAPGTQVAPPRTAGKRTIKPVQRLSIVANYSNQPLAMEFVNQQVPGVPVYAYTWHVTPFQALARVRAWPVVRPGAFLAVPIGPLQQIVALTSRDRVVAETQSAVNGRSLLIVAGDLNANKRAITTASGYPTIPFPSGKGFKVASGGSGATKQQRAQKDIDHIVACCQKRVRIRGTQPGIKIDDHRPVAATITF